MKKFNFYLSFLAVFALLFTSCSKDEDSGVNPDSEKATLSFGAIVQDLANKSTNKQSEVGDMPQCTDDTAAYVEIVLMQGDTEVVGTETEPFRVDLVAGQLFTKEVSELELSPGTYTLSNFAVYNEDGTLIWLAPKGGDLAQFVENPLPLEINLGAGVKKYVEVDVICYDDRDVNQYGYQFFELDLNKAFEYCFFANYCTPEGRHFPAHYSVDISIDGNTIYSGKMNTVGTNEDGDLFAEPLCFALPDLEEYADDEEYIDYTVTLLDWEEEGAYGDVEQVEISGSLSRAEVMANFDGEEAVDYEHIRFGCGDDGQEPDADNDGVIDTEDDCPNEPGPASNNGCPVEDNDADDDGVIDSNDNCVNVANPDQTNTDGDELGDACDPDDDNDGVNDDADECPLVAGSPDNNGCPVEGDSDNDGVVDSIDECENTPVGAEVNEVGCPLDSDEDGVYDGIDQCPDTQLGVQVDTTGCPVQVADCIPAPVTGCDTSEATTLTVVDGFKISQEFYGDITIQVDETTGNLSVGVTPIAPYELTDLQVYIESENLIQCFSTTEPESGVSGTIEGDFGNTAFDVEVTVNYCDVSN